MTANRTGQGQGQPTDRGRLAVVAYHYVRDLTRSRFPRIKGLSLDLFNRQLDEFESRYEMASLASALDYLGGRYHPVRDLCLLTFDDGLKEHYAEVMPILVERGLSACFFPATSCLEGEVAPVHMIHFLLASCDIRNLERSLQQGIPADHAGAAAGITAEEVARCYPWDEPGVGRVKYLLNFVLAAAVRDPVVGRLFAEHVGDAPKFARELYVSWDELREMQAHAMVIGGHSHAHRALPALSRQEQSQDLSRSTAMLRERLGPQDVWPFAYPYGWHDDVTIDVLRDLDYRCAFTVLSGANDQGQDAFRLRRFDTVQLLPA